MARGRFGRGYSWPPFAPGNEAHLAHGGYSVRRWGPVAERLAAELPVSAPWTARPAYAGTVAAWARVEAQLQLVSAWLDEVGLLDSKGKPRAACVLLDRLESRAAKLRAELGLGPQSLARLLVVTAAVDRAAGGGSEAGLASLVAEGRAALEAGARSLPGDSGVPGGGEAGGGASAGVYGCLSEVEGEAS